MAQAICVRAGDHSPMRTENYIEALLVDEELADQVWDRWDKGEISDFWAVWMWWTIVEPCSVNL
jgi:hypothetical protein